MDERTETPTKNGPQGLMTAASIEKNIAFGKFVDSFALRFISDHSQTVGHDEDMDILN